MTPQAYDAWYETPRGRWIGGVEWMLVRKALDLRPDDSVLDVGCGTGWFTRRAESAAGRVVGLDVDQASLDYARRRGLGKVQYMHGDAVGLPFENGAFDKVMSVAALCFVDDWPRAMAEIARVSRQRFAIGLLNRTSLLHLTKHRSDSAGGYAGAHWHTRDELARVMETLPVDKPQFSFGVFVPSGGGMARLVERLMPACLPLGAFLLVTGGPTVHRPPPTLRR